MKIVASSDNKKKILISRNEWKAIGKMAKWNIKKASDKSDFGDIRDAEEAFNPAPLINDEEEEVKKIKDKMNNGPDKKKEDQEELRKTKKFYGDIRFLAFIYVVAEQNGIPFEEKLKSFKEVSCPKDVVDLFVDIISGQDNDEGKKELFKIISEERVKYLIRLDKLVKTIVDAVSGGDIEERHDLFNVEWAIDDIKKIAINKVVKGTPLYEAIVTLALSKVNSNSSIRELCQDILNLTNTSSVSDGKSGALSA